MEQDVKGFCPFCKTNQDVVGVSEEQAQLIAEDAQDPADYYLLVEHPPTGEQ